MTRRTVRIAAQQGALIRDGLAHIAALEQEHARRMREAQIALQSVLRATLAPAQVPADWHLVEVRADNRQVTVAAPEARPNGV